MKNFESWALDEGMLSLSPSLSKVRAVISDLSSVSGGLPAVWEMLQKKYPSIWAGIQKIMGNPAAVADLNDKLEKKKNEWVEEGVSEGTFSSVSPSFDALAKVGEMIGTGATFLGYGAAGVVLLWLAIKYHQDLFNLLSSAKNAVVSGMQSIGSKKQPESQSTLAQLKKQREKRDMERRAQREKIQGLKDRGSGFEIKPPPSLQQ